jgi:hypothetical protein
MFANHLLSLQNYVEWAHKKYYVEWSLKNDQEAFDPLQSDLLTSKSRCMLVSLSISQLYISLVNYQL